MMNIQVMKMILVMKMSENDSLFLDVIHEVNSVKPVSDSEVQSDTRQNCYHACKHRNQVQRNKSQCFATPEIGKVDAEIERFVEEFQWSYYEIQRTRHDTMYFS